MHTAHILHLDTWTRSANGYTGTFCTWTYFAHGLFCSAERGSSDSELDADDHDAALAPSPERRAATTGELQLPALVAISATGPSPQHRESPGYVAGGTWQQAAWSPRSRTPASWATWVRAGRSGGRATGLLYRDYGARGLAKERGPPERALWD